MPNRGLKRVCRRKKKNVIDQMKATVKGGTAPVVRKKREKKGHVSKTRGNDTK